MTRNSLNYDALEKDIKKPRKNSRRKGANYERKLAKQFEDRFDQPFMRTPGSGAFATTHRGKGILNEMRGDLIVPQGFKFLIEAKSGYVSHLYMDKLFDPRSKLYEFIRQAKRDAEKAHKEWMVIWKGDRKKDLVFTQHDRFPSSPKVVVNTNCYMYKLENLINMPDCFWFK